jgi:predicted Rossmann-fold nucleotide-binding protein
MGCDIVTGGGPGLMQAANEGAAGAPERSRSYGIRVELPFEQDVNAFVSQAFEHRTFFTRLHQFVIASDSFLVTPGGIGTVLETLMIWQLLQVRHLENTPLILVGKMWPPLIEWAKASMLSTDPPLANPEDMTIPLCVADADEAVARIRTHHGAGLRTRRKKVKAR